MEKPRCYRCHKSDVSLDYFGFIMDIEVYYCDDCY